MKGTLGLVPGVLFWSVFLILLGCDLERLALISGPVILAILILGGIGSCFDKG